MSFGDTFENDLMKLVFNGDAIANIADNAASGPLTEYYLALHTADPGEAGDQTTNECTYTSYARTSVARTSAGFTVSANVASLTAEVAFPQATGGSETATYFSVGTAASGAGKIIGSGSLNPTIPISNGVLPRLSTGTTINLN